MKTIDSTKLVELLKGGAELLQINKDLVDSMNVFPVPDGDTGTNMSLTFLSGIKELEAVASEDLDDRINAFSTGVLKGARGNSGVILSQIIKGIAREVAKATEITTKIFAQGLVAAAEIAYGSVSKPKEGTILTVIRLIAEVAPKLASKNKEFKPFLEKILKRGEEVLATTPDMLPVLKKANVVDAGGKGLLLILEGFYYVVAGKDFPAYESTLGAIGEADDSLLLGDFGDLADIKYAYCTEYFVINTKKSATEDDIDKLREKLLKIGDSVIVIGDLTLAKVHVHTNAPSRALQFALQVGEIDKIKIDNMLEQAREMKRKREATKKEQAMIAICAGTGVSDIFKELLVDTLIEGGQTMNPSVDDIVSAIERTNSDKIIILPNNKNIILAAEQARELTKKTVEVLPTMSIPQGITAALTFLAEEGFEDNVANMRSAFDAVKCVQITTAVRDIKMDGFAVKAGDIIGMDDKKLVARGAVIEDVCKKAIDKLLGDESTLVTIYYGEDVQETDARALFEKLAEVYTNIDVILQNGGQPHYQYMVAIE